MLVRILIGLFVVIAAVGVYAAIKMPTSFVVKRSLLLKGAPETLFLYANNAQKAQEWNPFTEGDATLKVTHRGPAEGIGAETAWTGNAESGIGKITIVKSEPNRSVGVRLDFEKPFKGTNFGEYLFEPQDGGTLVTWSITETSFPPRLISVFLDLDKMIGSKFEKGLANLKALTER